MAQIRKINSVPSYITNSVWMHGGAYFARWVRFLLGRTFGAADRSPLSWGYGVMADTADSKPVVERRVGSSPTSPTKLNYKKCAMR